MELIGIAITTWAHVETELFHIFQACLETTPERAAIVFYRTPTLEGRISLTEEIVATVLPKRDRKDGGHHPDEVREWKSLVSAIRDGLQIRNQIAHSPVHVVQLDEKYFRQESRRSATHDLRGRPNDKPVTDGDLINHLSELTSMINRLRDFRFGELPKRLKSLPVRSALQPLGLKRRPAKTDRS